MSKYELNDIIIYKNNMFKIIIGNCGNCTFHKLSNESTYGCGFYAQHLAGVNLIDGCADCMIPKNCCFIKITSNLNKWRNICLK